MVLTGERNLLLFLKFLLDNMKKGSILGDRLDMVVVAQLVRAPGCGPGGRGFKSHLPPHFVLSPRSSPRIRAFLLPRKTPCTNGICKTCSKDAFSAGELSAGNPGPNSYEKTPKFSAITANPTSTGECISPETCRRRADLLYAAGE